MWPSLHKLNQLQKYRGPTTRKMVPRFNDNYLVYLHLEGEDHYHTSDRDPRRPVRRKNATTWEFLGSDGNWKPFNSHAAMKVEAAYKAMRAPQSQVVSRKRKRTHELVPRFHSEYSVYLDLSGDNHYQHTESNDKMRAVRRNDKTWEFQRSDRGWRPYDSKYQSKIETTFQNIRPLAPVRPPAPVRPQQHTNNSLELNFLSLMKKIHVQALRGEFAKIYTDTKSSLSFKATFGAHPGSRNTRLRHRQTDKWQFLENLSNDGTMLLIPPRKYDSTDISDFASKYGEAEWKILFEEMKKHLTKDYWVYTHGGGEDILHVRFEPFPNRKYSVA